MPPSYGSQAYWDDRFQTEDVYEWLMPADSFDVVVRGALHNSPARDPSILHIGCGSSNVSFQLRRLVASAKQVTNVDYSDVAVKKCLQRELQFLGTTGGPRALERMRWETLDLLSAESLAALMRTGPADDGAPRLFDVVVDKSTSDSIACSADADTWLPFAAPTQPGADAPPQPRKAFKVHPLHLLAVHLASVTRPGTGRWCVLSYSDDRYPFLSSATNADEDANVDPWLLDKGFPDPRKLWRLERRQEIVPELQKPEAPNNGDFVVHRPITTHWLYILARTETEL